MENTSTVSSYLGEKEIQELLTSKSLIIRPLLDNSQINGISIDFRLGTDFLVSIQGREAFINASLNYEKSGSVDTFFQETRRKVGETFLLHPNQTVLASSLEYIKLPQDIFAVLSMRSSYSRLGLSISSSLQPGYCGCISLELINTNKSAIKLTVGACLFQASFGRIICRSNTTGARAFSLMPMTILPWVRLPETSCPATASASAAYGRFVGSRRSFGPGLPFQAACTLAIRSAMPSPTVAASCPPSQLEKIANSLKISPYAMSDPNFDTYVSVMHALFALEDQYGLHAYRDESGVPQLMFKDKGHDSLNMLDHIGTWADMYQKFRNEEITEKEYLDWKSQFPAK